jgi:DNA-binding XRE family transcriptional regulator
MPPLNREAAVAVGQAVREHRQRRGIPQDRLAWEAGLERKTVYQLEHGLVDTRYGTLRRVARVLGVRVSDLVQGAERGAGFRAAAQADNVRTMRGATASV